MDLKNTAVADAKFKEALKEKTENLKVDSLSTIKLTNYEPNHLIYKSLCKATLSLQYNRHRCPKNSQKNAFLSKFTHFTFCFSCEMHNDIILQNQCFFLKDFTAGPIYHFIYNRTKEKRPVK